MSLKSSSDNEDTDEAVGGVGGEDIIDFESSSSEARRNLKWSILSKVYQLYCPRDPTVLAYNL